jgi:hypothetical protein
MLEPFEMAKPSHVQVAGQSLSAVQTIESATQLDVVNVVVVQPLVGAEPPSTGSSGGDVMTPASTGSAGGLVATGGDATVVPAELPDELAPEFDPTPVPEAPPPLALAQQVVDVSGTQVKWSPQSALTLHGNSYLGKHELGSVTVVHVGGVGGGHATCETPPSASAGPLTQASPGEEHSWYESAWHTMSGAQSASVAQGASWQV